MHTLRAAFLLAFTALALISPPARSDTYLTLAGGEPERELVCLVLEERSPFFLEFVNSIYQAPVRETFLYEPSEGVCLVKVESPSAAVFEYYSLIPDASGTALLHRPVGDFRIRTHDYLHHRLVVGGRSVRLKGVISDGESLLVKVRAGGS